MNERQILEIKKRLKQSRKNNGLTISQMAEGVNVSNMAVYKWENVSNTALPTLDHIIEICWFLNVTADWLLFGKGE